MGVDMKISGEHGIVGFLLAPSGGHEFPAKLSLKTDDGTTVKATIVVKAPAGVIVHLSSSSVTITPTGKTLKIVAKTASKRMADISVQVRVGTVEAAISVLTSIKNPRVEFYGRFQARFATDGDFFNEPRGTIAGWTWALEGEPDFVPSTNNVPIHSGMAVGRVVRFQNAVAPRTHVAPIGVKVTAVQGEVGNRIMTFPAGDPIIGEHVSLGPNTYLAANSPAPLPPSPQPFEQSSAGLEPMENFEIHLGTRFSGKPATLNDRPKASGVPLLTPAELSRYGIVSLNTFNSQRKQLLLTDYHNLSPAARTGTVAGRNLARRIGFLGGSAADNIPAAPNTTLPRGWWGKEIYVGNVNDLIQITPGNSIVMAYFKTFQAFRFEGTLFNLHSDELCGQVHGTLEPLTAGLNRQME